MVALLFCVVFLSTLKALLPLILPKFNTRSVPDIESLQNFAAHNNVGNLPLWTILAPLYNESLENLIKLRENIFASKYPNFEVIYLCEEVDVVTNFFLQTNAKNHNERIVVVPRIPPFTKPKACNYGLEFARGEYIVIYDVEDVPHPYQLHCAAYYMQKLNYDCLQFPLQFINDGTLMSGWQVVDYVLWYSSLLPILQKLHAPIPLGGTSNHFCVRSLRKISGWNSFNVTEDAELGLRMKLQGQTVYYIEGYATNEPTLPNIKNLVNQRVRWSKGHLITFLQKFPHFLITSPLNALCIFFTLAASHIACVGYIIITLFLDITQYPQSQQIVIMKIFIWGILLFFLYPALLLAKFPKLRKKSIIRSVMLYNIYMVFYMLPIVKSLIECLFRPSVWYKTMR